MAWIVDQLSFLRLIRSTKKGLNSTNSSRKLSISYNKVKDAPLIFYSHHEDTSPDLAEFTNSPKKLNQNIITDEANMIVRISRELDPNTSLQKARQVLGLIGAKNPVKKGIDPWNKDGNFLNLLKKSYTKSNDLLTKSLSQFVEPSLGRVIIPRTIEKSSNRDLAHKLAQYLKLGPQEDYENQLLNTFGPHIKTISKTGKFSKNRISMGDDNLLSTSVRVLSKPLNFILNSGSKSSYRYIRKLANENSTQHIEMTRAIIVSATDSPDIKSRAFPFNKLVNLLNKDLINQIKEKNLNFSTKHKRYLYGTLKRAIIRIASIEKNILRFVVRARLPMIDKNDLSKPVQWITTEADMLNDELISSTNESSNNKKDIEINLPKPNESKLVETISNIVSDRINELKSESKDNQSNSTSHVNKLATLTTEKASVDKSSPFYLDKVLFVLNPLLDVIIRHSLQNPKASHDNIFNSISTSLADRSTSSEIQSNLTEPISTISKSSYDATESMLKTGTSPKIIYSMRIPESSQLRENTSVNYVPPVRTIPNSININEFFKIPNEVSNLAKAGKNTSKSYSSVLTETKKYNKTKEIQNNELSSKNFKTEISKDISQTSEKQENKITKSNISTLEENNLSKDIYNDTRSNLKYNQRPLDPILNRAGVASVGLTKDNKFQSLLLEAAKSHEKLPITDALRFPQLLKSLIALIRTGPQVKSRGGIITAGIPASVERIGGFSINYSYVLRKNIHKYKDPLFTVDGLLRKTLGNSHTPKIRTITFGPVLDSKPTKPFFLRAPHEQFAIASAFINFNRWLLLNDASSPVPRDVYKTVTNKSLDSTENLGHQLDKLSKFEWPGTVIRFVNLANNMRYQKKYSISHSNDVWKALRGLVEIEKASTNSSLYNNFEVDQSIILASCKTPKNMLFKNDHLKPVLGYLKGNSKNPTKPITLLAAKWLEAELYARQVGYQRWFARGWSASQELAVSLIANITKLYYLPPNISLLSELLRAIRVYGLESADMKYILSIVTNKVKRTESILSSLPPIRGRIYNKTIYTRKVKASGQLLQDRGSLYKRSKLLRPMSLIVRHQNIIYKLAEKHIVAILFPDQREQYLKSRMRHLNKYHSLYDTDIFKQSPFIQRRIIQLKKMRRGDARQSRRKTKYQPLTQSFRRRAHMWKLPKSFRPISNADSSHIHPIISIQYHLRRSAYKTSIFRVEISSITSLLHNISTKIWILPHTICQNIKDNLTKKTTISEHNTNIDNEQLSSLRNNSNVQNSCRYWKNLSEICEFKSKIGYLPLNISTSLGEVLDAQLTSQEVSNKVKTKTILTGSFASALTSYYLTIDPDEIDRNSIIIPLAISNSQKVLVITEEENPSRLKLKDQLCILRNLKLNQEIQLYKPLNSNIHTLPNNSQFFAPFWSSNRSLILTSGKPQLIVFNHQQYSILPINNDYNIFYYLSWTESSIIDFLLLVLQLSVNLKCNLSSFHKAKQITLTYQNDLIFASNLNTNLNKNNSQNGSIQRTIYYFSGEIILNSNWWYLKSYREVLEKNIDYCIEVSNLYSSFDKNIHLIIISKILGSVCKYMHLNDLHMDTVQVWYANLLESNKKKNYSNEVSKKLVNDSEWSELINSLLKHTSILEQKIKSLIPTINIIRENLFYSTYISCNSGLLIPYFNEVKCYLPSIDNESIKNGLQNTLKTSNSNEIKSIKGTHTTHADEIALRIADIRERQCSKCIETWWSNLNENCFTISKILITNLTLTWSIPCHELITKCCGTKNCKVSDITLTVPSWMMKNSTALVKNQSGILIYSWPWFLYFINNKSYLHCANSNGDFYIYKNSTDTLQEMSLISKTEFKEIIGFYPESLK